MSVYNSITLTATQYSIMETNKTEVKLRLVCNSKLCLTLNKNYKNTPFIIFLLQIQLDNCYAHNHPSNFLGKIVRFARNF